jgi:2-iminobutanoate/2-iminopropanoate deaminase
VTGVAVLGEVVNARIFTTVALALLATCRMATAQDDTRHIVLEPSAARDALPFSDAVLKGHTLYLSGYIGVDGKTGKVPASATEETRLAMDDLERTVKAAGMTMDDLVQVHVYATDLSLFKDFNAVYRGYFHHGYPSRTFTGASGLLMGAHFEITGIAIKSGK